MSEYIISDVGLRCMRSQCYEAGKLGKEIFTVRGHSGEEVIRCRDCKRSREKGWKCTYWASGEWDEEQEADVIELADVEPDGFCFKAERREA